MVYLSRWVENQCGSSPVLTFRCEQAQDLWGFQGIYFDRFAIEKTIKMKSTQKILFALAICGAMFLTACGGEQEPAETETENTEMEAESMEEETMEEATEMAADTAMMEADTAHAGGDEHPSDHPE